MVEETEVITIRVPKSLKLRLEEKSKKEDHALNLTINKILSKEVKWEGYTSELRWMAFDPSVVREIFSNLTVDQIRKISKQTRDVIISNITFIYEHPTLDNTMDFIVSWMNASNMSHRLVKNDHYKLVVTHDLGKNWSIFANSLIKEWFEELGFRIEKQTEEVKGYSFEVYEK